MKTRVIFSILISAILLLSFTKKEIAGYAISNPGIVLTLSDNVPDIFTKTGIDYLINQMEPRHPIQFNDLLFLPWNSIDSQNPELDYPEIEKVHNTYAEYAKKNPEKILEFIKEWHDYVWKTIEEKHGKETEEDLQRQLRSVEALLIKISNASDSKILELQKSSIQMEKMSQIINKKYSKNSFNKYKKAKDNFYGNVKDLGINITQKSSLLDPKIYIPRLMCRTVNAPDSKFTDVKKVAITSLQLITAAK